MKSLKWLFVFAFGAVAVQGQQYIYVDDGAITGIGADTSIYPTNVVVGYTQSGNMLYVDDGITLNAGSIFVGVSNSTDNVLQFDPSSKGYFTGQLVIGTDSSDNTMNIFEEADVVSTYGTIGHATTADDNVVDISGSGSSWNVVSNLAVGLEGSGNSLLVSDEAVVAANAIFIGVGQAATNNQIIVDYASLIATENLVVGDAGIGSLLVVTNGGSATAADVVIGYYEESTGNVVRVGGTDSILTVSDSLTVGTVSNEANRVVVSDGGTVQVGELLIGGDENYFDLNEGGQLTVDGDFNASMDGFNYNEGSALYVGGELSGQTNGLEGGRALGMSGADAIWDQTGSNITVGGSSSDNSLVVEDDAKVIVDNLMVGTGSNVVGNTVSISVYDAEVAVAGTVVVGSVDSSDNLINVTRSGQLTVGDTILFYGSNNTLRVSGGGRLRVENDFDASIDGFNFDYNGILETTGTLTGMTNVLEDGRSVRLDSGGTWLAGNLIVGDATSGSSVRLSDGGNLGSTGAVLGNTAGADNNEVLVDGASSVWLDLGTITVGAAGSSNTVSVTDGGTVQSSGLIVGSSGDDNSVFIGGTGASWDISGDVTVGGTGSDNQLFVESGGLLKSAAVTIGGSGTGNGARVSGSGSEWVTTGDVTVTGAGNSLNLSDSGNINVGNQLVVEDGAALVFETGGTVFATSGYYQEGTALLQFDSVTNVAVDPSTALVSTPGTAEFEDGATIEFTGTLGEVGVGVTNSRRLVSSSSLMVDGGTNLNALVGVAENNYFEITFLAQNDDLYMQLYRQRLADSAGFESNTMMYAVCDDIDIISTNSSAGSQQAAINQLTLLDDLSSAQKNAQLTQLYDRGAPTYMHMQGMLQGMREVKKNGVMPDSMWPVGANGPHLYGEQAKVWLKGYGSWGSQDGSGSNSGYDQNVYGVIVGFDKAFGDLLAGLAGGYASSDISQDDGDDSESTTGYGVLYGSWGSSDWFADGSLAFGMGSVENDTGTIFDNSGDTDATQLAFSLGGGKEMIYMEDRLFVTPSAAFLAGWYMQDGYTEKAVNAVARKVDDYDRWSMQSDFGVEASFHKPLTKVTLMPSAHMNWLHEFNADADRVGYSLVDGTGNYSFGMQSPVADIFELGIGLSLWAEDKNGTVYEWALGYDARFGDGYSASAFSARLVAEF